MSQMGQYDYLLAPFATITGNTGDVVVPINNNVNILGSDHLSFSGVAATATLTLSLDGEIADTYTTDSGNAVPAVSILQVLGGSNIGTTGATNVVTINLDADITMPNAGTIRSGTTAADKFYLQAYDVNGTVYVTFATLTSNNTPTMDLSTDVTIGTNYIYRAGGTDIPVTDGGTGASTFTDHGLLVGSGALAFDALSVGSTGQILQGVSANDPTWSTATYPSTVLKGDVLLATADNVIGVVNSAKVAGKVLMTAGVTFAASFSDIILPVTAAKGDIIYASAANTYENLTAGDANKVLTSHGAGTAPTWEVTAVTGIVNLKGDDTNTATGTTVNINGGSNLVTSASGATLVIDMENSITLTGDVTALNLKTSTVANNLTLNGNTITSGGSGADVDINLVAKGVGGLTFDGISTGWSSSQWNIRQAQKQTTDATETVLVTIALDEGEMITVTSTVNGFQNDFTDCLGGTCVITAYRPTGGNVTQVGEELLNINSTSTASLTAGVSVGTQSLTISVIGVAAETWNWVSCHQYMFTKTNA